MIYINLKELRELKEKMTLTQLAKHYNVDLFDLNNFIYSHQKRNGIYPVDGARDRSNVKPVYNYPNKLSLVNKLKFKTAHKIAQEMGLSYTGLLRHMTKLGLR